ncbi:MAG TPA: hypothetical protein PKC72_04195 [Chitinophagaceae bacterium]|nr:hypothetical protein [Chitinophagaceae bacterium]
MKKAVTGCILLMIVSIACSKKSLPEITARTLEPQQPVSAKVDVVPNIETGKIIFSNRCSRCHGLPEPSQYSEKRWETILSVMVPRARLTKEQEIHVREYVLKNASK